MLAVLVAGACLIAAESPAAGDSAVRPTRKGAKPGALGKDYFVLPRVYFWSIPGPAGSTITAGVPAGVYRIRFEDDGGYYLPAPAKFGGKVAGDLIEWEGGLYVRKHQPTLFYLYATRSDGTIEGPGQKLPPDFAKQLKH
jgi:hypothetical protein